MASAAAAARHGVVGKAQLAAALGEFELSAGVMTQALAAGSDATVASQHQGGQGRHEDQMAGGHVGGSDLDWPGKDTAESAWTNVEQAIDALADNATVATANAALMPGLDASWRSRPNCGTPSRRSNDPDGDEVHISICRRLYLDPTIWYLCSL